MTDPTTPPAPTPAEAPERAALLQTLQAQRTAALAIVDGLSDAQLRSSVVPSGWTPIGIVEHLGGAEFFWFQVVASGRIPQPPEAAAQESDEGWEPGQPFDTDEPPQQIFAEYREQCAESDRVIAELSLSAPPAFLPRWKPAAEVPDVRSVILHVIEETARHLGHLDIARELLDGHTGIALR